MKVLAIGNENRELKGGWFLANELELAKLQLTREWNVVYELDNAWTNNMTMEAVYKAPRKMPTMVALENLIRHFREEEEKLDRISAQVYEEGNEEDSQFYSGKSLANRQAWIHIKGFIDAHYEELVD